MPHLAIDVLGALQVTLDGHPVTGFESAKARALLVYLAVESNQPHPRDALAGLLWPEESDRSARNNLRQTLANVRQAIGDRASAGQPFLLVTREAIQFRVSSDCTLDLNTFDSLLTACSMHAHRHPEGCKSCADRMQRAVELYRGDFMAQFFLSDSAPFEEWALVQRENLNRRALEALDCLAEYHSRRGAHEQALALARRALGLDPWREEAHRQVMRSLALSGQRGAALVQYETCRRVLAEEMKVEPSAETAALYEEIKTGNWKLEVSGWKQSRISNVQPQTSDFQLPTPSTPFLGREKELAELAELLANPTCRLISIVGPGGMGKTRLALAAAVEQAVGFRDGVVFVPLASVRSPDLVISAILVAVGITPQGPSDPKDQLFAHLRERELLLIFDNWEHLLGGTALLSELLQRAPRLALLVTSRERLNLQGEWVLDLAGLEIPEGRRADEVEAYSAVQLFLQSARRVRSGRSFSDEEKASIVRICRLVEGMPLAIELAAAWARTLSCRQIAEEIEKSYGFLAGSLRDLPERHRSLRAVFEHSWNLLGEEERSVLSALSVFRGGFGREAAERVAGACLSILAALVDKSLVRSDGADRYDLHELVRQFAHEKLLESAEMEQTRDRHLDYFAALAKQAEPYLPGRDQHTWLERLEAEIDNLRAALEWSLEGERAGTGLRLAGALWRFWYTRGHLSEGRQWLGQLLAQSGDTPSADKNIAVYGAGGLALLQADLASARSYAEASLAIARQLSDPTRIAHSARLLGIIAREQGEYAASRAHFQESLAILEQLGDRHGIAWLLINMGESARGQGDYAAALALYSRSLGTAQDLGDKEAVAIGLMNSGHIAHYQGDLEKARALYGESLQLFQSLRAEQSIAECLAGFAGLAASQNRPERAARLFGAAERLLQAIDYHLYQADQADYDRALAVARAQLGAVSLAGAMEEGRAMTIEQAIALALDGLDENASART